MRLVIASRAERDIKNQIAYGIQKFGQAVAERTFERIFDYLEGVLVHYPRTGKFDPELNVFETWIPRTPFVVLYKLVESSNELIVVALFHHAQDRATSEDDFDD